MSIGYSTPSSQSWSTDLEHDFVLPDLGEGLEEATVVEWNVRPGDHVSLNDPICALETAKAEVELPSPFRGQSACDKWSTGRHVASG